MPVRWRADVGASRTGFGLYELDPGQATWPYHFELGEEEWLFVINGELALRSPEGDRVAAGGRHRVLSGGAAGAHQCATTRMRSCGSPCRRSNAPVGRGVHPDSNKLLVTGPGSSTAVSRGRGGYWEGEP